MERVTHETCLEYFHRRLSEGWKCISLDGYNAILQSPEGVLRPVDLRHAIETLRPIGVGDITNIPTVFGALTHWEAVDDPGAGDDDATYVVHDTEFPDARYDLYELANTALVGETINSVRTYARMRVVNLGNAGNGRTVILTAAAEHRGANNVLPFAYALYSTLYALNPETGLAWTVALINALQPGVDLTNDLVKLWAQPRCTQVYVEVDYTEAGGLGNKSAGMSAKMVAAELI